MINELPRNPWAYLGSIHPTQLIYATMGDQDRKEQLKGIVGKKKHEVVIEIIFRIIEEEHGITREAILAKPNRKQSITHLRQFICYWVRQYYGLALILEHIASAINREHTTISYSINCFQQRLDANELLPPGLRQITAQEDYKLLTDKIYQQLCS